ncbi:hypothetical protein C8J57DRAFT_1269539 [Mycena rebaudengoi]|nr:hypothetical protein C8J57DRAFT_1269539 [Mycena rebaudengoi]
MAQPAASIRLLEPADEKLARFMIGKANMEYLASANRKAYYNPLVVSLWVGLSCIFTEYMKWWPDLETSVLTCVNPFPAFACVWVPIMFGIDWLNRPDFESLTQDALRGPDMKDSISAYYSRSPASGFWILNYGDRFVGLIAIDASNQDQPANKKSTAQTAIIRHFYVQEPYPAANIQDDLLSHAVNQCFKSGIVQQIKAADTPLVPYVQKSLRAAGFILEDKARSVGVFRWKLGTSSLSRSAWEHKKN